MTSDDGAYLRGADVIMELDRAIHPSLSGAQDPSGNHGLNDCRVDDGCVKQCTPKQDEAGRTVCAVVADGCRDCLLTSYGRDSGTSTWKQRTYATVLHPDYAMPCFSCGSWDGPMADPERVTMQAPCVSGVATAAIGSKIWTPNAGDPGTDEGRRFMSAFRYGVAKWVTAAVADRLDPDSTGGYPGSVPADTVMVEYVHRRSASEVSCKSGCANRELIRDPNTQFVNIQWYIVVGSGVRYSEIERSMPGVIRGACEGVSPLDFDTEEYGNLGFSLLNCLTDTPSSGLADVIELGSIIGEDYFEPQQTETLVLYAFVMCLLACLLKEGHRRHKLHMKKWDDLHDGQKLFAKDPLARMYLPEDLKYYQALIKQERKQSLRYQNDEKDEELFENMDAMAALLQQLIVENDGQFPRKDLRQHVVERIDSAQMASALSLVDRYNLDRPKPRAQAVVEQLVNPNQVVSLGTRLGDKETMGAWSEGTGLSESLTGGGSGLSESLTGGVTDDADWDQDLGAAVASEALVQEVVLVEVEFSGTGPLGMMFEEVVSKTRRGTVVRIKSVVDDSIAHDTERVHRGMILRRINDKEVLAYASGMQILGAEWKGSDRMTLTFQRPNGPVTPESSEGETESSEEDDGDEQERGGSRDIELGADLMAALGGEVRQDAADFRANGETTGNPLSGGAAPSARYRHDFAAIEKQNGQYDARSDAYRHNMAPILGTTNLKNKQTKLLKDAHDREADMAERLQALRDAKAQDSQ